VIDLDAPECPHGYPDLALISGKHRCPFCRREQQRRAEQAERQRRLAQDPTTPDPAALAANDHTLFGEDSPA
jgi:hypothetical protein